MATIKFLLGEFNRWWRGGFDLEFKHRDIHERIQRYLSMPQIIAFTGLRRVGKTTLMLKIVLDYIEKGFDPRRIVYFSFDEPGVMEIHDVLRQYEEMIQTDIRKGEYLLLLDEIQKLVGWEEQLKTVYDLYKGSVKIIISGSESLFIRGKSKEVVAGRIFEFEVDPLSFREFLLFKGVTFEPISLYMKELTAMLKEFSLTQGFPELVGIRDRAIIRKYIEESIVEKVVYRDMPHLFKIRDISAVRSLLNIMMEDPGQLVQMSDVANQLKISRQTVSNYLTYLEESFLIRKLYNFSKSRRKVERKLKKYYPSMISVDLLFREDDHSRSTVFEWLMVTQLKAEFFWRDPYKNEVDIVLTDEEITPIEVKYGRINLKPLFVFMKKFMTDKAYVISREQEEVRKNDLGTVWIIPGYRFLLQNISHSR